MTDGVRDLLGSPVVSAQSQCGGFSPGSADRVVLADGRRAFVKAVSAADYATSAAMHRRELQVTRGLRGPVPRLLGAVDDGTWVALVLDDIDGSHPATPWLNGELDLVLDGLEQLVDINVAATLAPATERLAEDFAGWNQWCANPPSDIDPWLRAHAENLRLRAARAAPSLTGDSLTHVDLRADNILIEASGRAVFVDWAHGCCGPHWLDTLLLLVNVELHGGIDTDAVLESRRLTRDVPDFVLTDVLIALAGYFVHHARLPSPPGLPTLRQFQAEQGASTLAWARRRGA